MRENENIDMEITDSGDIHVSDNRTINQSNSSDSISHTKQGFLTEDSEIYEKKTQKINSFHVKVVLSNEENSLGFTNQGFRSEEYLSRQSSSVEEMENNVIVDDDRTTQMESGFHTIQLNHQEEDSDENKDEDSLSQEDQYDTPDEDSISHINLVISSENSLMSQMEKRGDTNLDSISQVIQGISSKEDGTLTKEDEYSQNSSLDGSTSQSDENLPTEDNSTEQTTNCTSTVDNTAEEKRLSGQEFINQLMENLSVRRLRPSSDEDLSVEDSISQRLDGSIENDQTTLIPPPQGNISNQKRLSGQDFINQLVEEFSSKEDLHLKENDSIENETNQDSAIVDSTTHYPDLSVQKDNTECQKYQDLLEDPLIYVEQDTKLQCKSPSTDEFPNQTVSGDSISPIIQNLPTQKESAPFLEYHDQEESIIQIEQEDNLQYESSSTDDFFDNAVPEVAQQKEDAAVELEGQTSLEELFIHIEQEENYEASTNDLFDEDDVTISQESRVVSTLDDAINQDIQQNPSEDQAKQDALSEGDTQDALISDIEDAAKCNEDSSMHYGQNLQTITKENGQTEIATVISLDKDVMFNFSPAKTSQPSEHEESQSIIENQNIFESDLPDPKQQDVLLTPGLIHKTQEETSLIHETTFDKNDTESAEMRNRSIVIKKRVNENITNSKITVLTKTTKNTDNKCLSIVDSTNIDANMELRNFQTQNVPNRKVDRLLPDEPNNNWQREFPHEQIMLIYICYFVLVTFCSTLFTLILYGY